MNGPLPPSGEQSRPENVSKQPMPPKIKRTWSATPPGQLIVRTWDAVKNKMHPQTALQHVANLPDENNATEDASQGQSPDAPARIWTKQTPSARAIWTPDEGVVRATGGQSGQTQEEPISPASDSLQDPKSQTPVGNEENKSDISIETPSVDVHDNGKGVQSTQDETQYTPQVKETSEGENPYKGDFVKYPDLRLVYGGNPMEAIRPYKDASSYRAEQWSDWIRENINGLSEEGVKRLGVMTSEFNLAMREDLLDRKPRDQELGLPEFLFVWNDPNELMSTRADGKMVVLNVNSAFLQGVLNDSNPNILNEERTLSRDNVPVYKGKIGKYFALVGVEEYDHSIFWRKHRNYIPEELPQNVTLAQYDAQKDERLALRRVYRYALAHPDDYGSEELELLKNRLDAEREVRRVARVQRYPS